MESRERFKVEDIGGEYCDFEQSADVSDAFELLDPDAYPAEQRKLVEEFNRRAETGNRRYRLAMYRAEMFEKGFNAGMYICLFDREENMTDFIFTDETRRMLGYDGLEDLPNEFDSWVRTLLPAQREAMVPVFWSTVKNHRQLPDISHAEYPMVRKDGKIIWVTGAGRFIRRADGTLEIYMGCYRDVTAEHEKDDYLHIIEGIGKVFNFSIYIDMASETYQIVSTNEYVENVRKDPNAFQFLRDNVEFSVHPESREEMNAWFLSDNIRSLLKEKDIISRDFRSLAEDRWFRATFMVGDRNDDGSLNHLIYGCQEITDSKRKELANKKELEQARNSAEAANKAKTSFLFNMSHDIRTPMNAIIGYTDLIEKHYGEREKCMDYIHKTQGANRFLLSLINNVLEMARIESGNVALAEECWSTEQFNDALFSVFEEQMKQKNIRFTRTIRVQHPYVYCDSVKLREVYLNIISNAWKYTPAGGSVCMDLTEIPSDREGYALYRTTVSDTGIGMSREFLPHIFEEFSRAKSATDSGIEGTGLGMPIVKKYIDLMGGTIQVESEPGKGSTFTVSVYHRIADRSDFKKTVSPSSLDVTNMAGKRLLLAEDNDLNAEIAEEVLSEAGFKVERARNGAECVTMLQKAVPAYYDLILMDIQMPEMNGYEASRKIRSMEDKAKADIPILAMTANAFESDKQDAFLAGMNGHVAKPIEIPKLMEAIAEVLK